MNVWDWLGVLMACILVWRRAWRVAPLFFDVQIAQMCACIWYKHLWLVSHAAGATDANIRATWVTYHVLSMADYVLELAAVCSLICAASRVNSRRREDALYLVAATFVVHACVKMLSGADQGNEFSFVASPIANILNRACIVITIIAFYACFDGTFPSKEHHVRPSQAEAPTRAPKAYPETCR